MKKTNLSALFVLTAGLLIMLSSCVTPIMDMEIADLEVIMRDADGNVVETLLPDTEYEIDFRVTDAAGKLYKNPNYREFNIDRLTNLQLLQQARFTVTVRTSFESFHAPDRPAYGFRLAVKNNPYPVKFHSYDFDWRNYRSIDYSGMDGEDGENGRNGANASGESEDTVSGGSGEDGTDGTGGYNGQDVTLVIMKYIHDGNQRLLWYEPERDQLFLTEVTSITVDTRGGDGGDGGSAGNGGRGADYVDEGTGTVIKEGVPGNPGDSGDGGDAGNGGDITLLAVDPRLFNYAEPRFQGGDGGNAGGSGRSYDSDGDVVGWGGRGRSGRDGRDGDLKYVTISVSELQALVRKIDRPGFDADQVLN